MNLNLLKNIFILVPLYLKKSSVNMRLWTLLVKEVSTLEIYGHDKECLWGRSHNRFSYKLLYFLIHGINIMTFLLVSQSFRERVSMHIRDVLLTRLIPEMEG